MAEYGSSRQQKIMEEVERETAPAEPDTPKAPAPEQPSAPKPTETAPSPTPKSAMARWEERIAAAALEQDGEDPLADDSDPEEEPRTDDGPEPLPESGRTGRDNGRGRDGGAPRNTAETEMGAVLPEAAGGNGAALRFHGSPGGIGKASYRGREHRGRTGAQRGRV